MTRRIALKLVSLVALLVFQGTAFADAFGADGCAHHAPIPGAATGAGDDAAHSGHDGHGSAFAAHGVESHGSLDPVADHGEHDAPCTCVGACAMGPNAPVAASLDATRFAPIAGALEAASSPRRHELLPSAPSFLLPYAQGPPPAF